MQTELCKAQEDQIAGFFPLKDGTEYLVSVQQVKEWEAAFRRVDVVRELQKMYMWLEANPKRRKTRQGINRFVYSWLNREDRQRADAGSNPFADLLNGGMFGNDS